MHGKIYGKNASLVGFDAECIDDLLKKDYNKKCKKSYIMPPMCCEKRGMHGRKYGRKIAENYRGRSGRRGD